MHCLNYCFDYLFTSPNFFCNSFVLFYCFEMVKYSMSSVTIAATLIIVVYQHLQAVLGPVQQGDIEGKIGL